MHPHLFHHIGDRHRTAHPASLFTKEMPKSPLQLSERAREEGIGEYPPKWLPMELLPMCVFLSVGRRLLLSWTGATSELQDLLGEIRHLAFKTLFPFH